MIIALRGYGAFIYAGTVVNDTYEYFENEDIDLQEYAEYLDDPGSSNLQIPKEHDFVNGGCLYDVDNLWRISGAELTSDCILSVDLENGGDDWECALDLGTLEKLGIKTKCISSSTRMIMDLPSGTAIFMAKETTEGLQFEENQIISSSDFDPTKLEIYYHEYIDAYIVKHIKYDGRDYSGNDREWDTEYKDFKWHLRD